MRNRAPALSTMALVGLGLLLLAPAWAGMAAPPEAAEQIDAKAAYVQLEGSLVHDDVFLRHGAITNIPTCLAVAEDPAATIFWTKEFGGSESWTVRDDAALARDLEDRGDGIKDEEGFGTLLACAQIVAAWHSTLPDHRLGQMPRDGRIEHGAVVLDLQISGPRGRAAIAAQPLIRLLTSPGLLPPAAFGGLIIRNARVEGPLLLYNFHLERPLVFVKTEFAGQGYSKQIFAEEDKEGVALAIEHSRLSDYVSISDSTICGDVSILDSDFQETVLFGQVEQKSDGCGPLNPGNRFNIQGSQFQQSLNINRSDFGHLFLVSNDINTFLLSRNRLARFQVQDNDIGGVEIYGARFARDVVVNYNRIEGDFFLNYKEPEDPDGTAGSIETIEINSNRIGGGLGFRDFPKETIPVTLDFRSNRVGNGSEICLPTDWRGRLLLDGSTYEGTLAIGLSPLPRLEEDDPTGSGETEAAHEQADRDPPCYGPFFVEENRSVIEDFCSPAQESSVPAAADALTVPLDQDGSKLVIVEFEATSIRTLKWHMPFHCTYRWSGFGLTYDLWDAPAQARSAFANQQSNWREGAFNAWRTTLATYDPAALDSMSRYFADKGAHVASRNIKLEAKRLNYAPDCPPDEALMTCLSRVLWTSTAPRVIARAEAGTEDASDAWFEAWHERVWRAFKLVLLWPGGFGAQPERALMLLIGGVLFFALVYALYVASAWRRYGRLDALLGLLQENLREAAVPPGKAPGRGQQVRQNQRLLEVIREIRELRKRDGSHSEVSLAVRDRLLPELDWLPATKPGTRWLKRTLAKLGRDAGSTHVYGFSQFNAGQMPTRFTPLRYSIDTMVPVIDLHAYSSYYPEWWFMRGVTVVQHVLGWWWLSVFVASAAIL